MTDLQLPTVNGMREGGRERGEGGGGGGGGGGGKGGSERERGLL